MTPRFVLFEQICQVESVTIITERDADQSKGSVFGDIGNEDAEQAMAQINGTEVGGRSLTVNAAHPRKGRSGGRGDGCHHDSSDVWREAAPVIHVRRRQGLATDTTAKRGERRGGASRLRTVALGVGVSIHHPHRRSTSWLCAFLLGTSRMT